MALGLSAGIAPVAPAQPGRQTAGYAWDEPNWHFRHHDRQVKVVLLAGSIGAHRDMPYGRLLHQWCENAEIRNLSAVGLGIPQLATRFRTEVLENESVPVGAQSSELWLLFGGGMNSVGLPRRSVRALRSMIEQAHRRRIRVVALTLTPWGTRPEQDDRWAGARGLGSLRSTRHLVDYVLGRLSPEEALGSFRRERRGDPNGPWRPSERPDVAIDLYDSPLRARDAQPWPIERVRRSLERDPAYRRELAELPPGERPARLEADARELSEAPQWFLRREYRAFDHIHPNRAGHEAMARHMCPRLPASWGCQCP